MIKRNRVFIASSLDGFIADKNGNIDWLHSIPNPNQDDMGYSDFMEDIDAIILGRNTFETVCTFDIEWPYKKPVFVWSNSLKTIPEGLKENVFLVKGSVDEIIKQVHEKGFYRLYIDGGKTIQSFLAEDQIDEITLTTIPILLGSGKSLFSEIQKPLEFSCVASKIYLNEVVQNRYIRKR